MKTWKENSLLYLELLGRSSTSSALNSYKNFEKGGFRFGEGDLLLFHYRR